MKRPAFQFYGGDWLRDPGLRACSLAARGLWIDMISIMSQVADPYGHLVFVAKDGAKDGSKDILTPILPGVLARMVGTSEEQVVSLLAELEGFGVFSRTPEGVIYSRRMVQDEKTRQTRASGGSESLKNPKVPRRKDIPKDILKDDGRISFEGSLGGSPASAFASASAKEELAGTPTVLPAVVSIPLKDGTEHAITAAEIEHWSALYPAVDAKTQFREMRAWTLSNPSRRKTKPGINAFINRWLKKAQAEAPSPKRLPPPPLLSADVGFRSNCISLATIRQNAGIGVTQ